MRDIRNVMTKEKIKHHLANEMYGSRIIKKYIGAWLIQRI